MTEIFPTQHEGEKLTRAQLIGLLKENPNDLAPYISYRDQREQELPKNSIGGMQLIIEMATVCIEAEFYQEAYEALDAAIFQASNDEGMSADEREDLIAKLYSIIDTIPPLS